MRMDVSAVIMPIRMRNDHRLMSRKVLSAKLNSQFLRMVNSQPMIFRVTRIVTDNVVMALHISAQIVFPKVQIRSHTGNRKIIFTAQKRIHPILFPRNQITVLIP